MFVEDLFSLLALIARTKIIPTFDVMVISSIYDQTANNVNLTEKQGKLVLSLIKKYKTDISLKVGQNIDHSVDNPIFKNPFRVIQQKKNISIISHPTYNKVVKVEFPYNDELLTKFRQAKSSLDYAAWNNDEKCWLFSLDERSVMFLMSFIDEHSFVVDEELKDYISQVKKINENYENYVPMVKKDKNGKLKFVNVGSFFPRIESAGFLEFLFEARKAGIFTWDDEIEEQLNLEEISVRDFLKTAPHKHYTFNVEKNSMYCLAPVIKNLLPCLVVIPGGTELEKIQQNFEFFQNIGLHSNEMSVLFRLPTETGKEFNDYVRENKLNSGVSEKTKVVFISSQIPKTILSPKKIFNCVLNYNFYNVHFRIRDFVNWHENVINIIEKESQRRLNFGIM